MTTLVNRVTFHRYIFIPGSMATLSLLIQKDQTCGK